MAMAWRSRRRMGAGRPPLTVSSVSGMASTNTPELVVSFDGSAPLCEPAANAVSQSMLGASPCTSVKVFMPRSATASQVRSKSDMS